MKYIKLPTIILLVFFSLPLFAQTNDLYSFNTPSQQARFEYLTQQFRCMVCQNEALAESNAPLAKDLRKQIAVKVQQGYSDQEITQFLLKRFGDYVLFNPPMQRNTYFLWFGPFVLLLIAIFAIFMFTRNQRKAT